MNSAFDRTQLVKEALAQAQQTVRAYDIKAQIVGVGYMFALGIVFRLGEELPKVQRSDILLVIVGWAIVIFPILLFGFVLFPTRKSVSGNSANDAWSRGFLYFSPGAHASVDTYIEALSAADELREQTKELFVVTELRELKRKRFLRALFAAGVAFVLLFWVQVWRVLAGS
jgi:hypothetical protein